MSGNSPWTAHSTPSGGSSTLFSRSPMTHTGSEEIKLYSDTSVHTIGLSKVISEILDDIRQKVEHWKEFLEPMRKTLDVEDHVSLYGFVIHTLDALQATLKIDRLLTGDYLEAAGPEWLTKFNERLTQLTEFLLKWLARFPQEDEDGFNLTHFVKVTKIVGSYAPRVVQYANHVQSSLSILQAQRARVLAQRPITIRSTKSRGKGPETRPQNSAH
ncbi:hypothetical protein BDN72DRAFT_845377 [Pluteus cervinus]|uniref:Uncharacterized protein n=1 Tax=Pluteus cervinus TaxID=181527 RepID=A0ACD3AK27_9AGAR|nr:hypothetical protein BDN72DRAFT_845377 [Pluteus cervinus]